MERPAEVPPERNAEVHTQHRRETQRQIYLPLTIVGLVILVGVIFIIIYGLRVGSTLQRWASVSVIWVLIPFMFIGVLLLIVAVGCLYGITQLLGIAPGYFDIVQGYFRQAEAKVLQVTDGMVEPVLRVRSSWAVVARRKRLTRK